MELLKEVSVRDYRGSSDYYNGLELYIAWEHSCFNCRLEDGLNASELYENGQRSWVKTNTMITMAREIIQDLISCCTKDGGKTFHYSESGVSEFTKRWDMYKFGAILVKYNLIEKLSYESALQVIQEYFLVEPVINS